MAPEVIQTEHARHARYGTKCDIWALGITTIEMADKCPPLSDIHPMRALALIPKATLTLANPKAWSKGMLDFVARCLQRNPARRPDAPGCMAHPFLIASNNCLPSLMVAMIAESRNPAQSPPPKALKLPGKLEVGCGEAGWCFPYCAWE
jgi:serine/threonine protein kinase